MSETLATGPLPAGDQPAAIAKLLVRVTAEFTGRGPTHVRAYVNPDVITVILKDTLTKGERSLVRDGHSDIVIAVRRAFQGTMASTLIPAIESITGRQVSVFLSDHHIDPDVAVETFVLAEPGEQVSLTRGPSETVV